jgi:hypothetical protein
MSAARRVAAMTWEQRMSDRAQIRIQAEREVEKARMDAADAADDELRRALGEISRLVPPPQGCRSCYQQVKDWFSFGYIWLHRLDDYDGEPSDDLARYLQHGTLCFCGCHYGHGTMPLIMYPIVIG